MIPRAGSAYTYGYVALGELVGWFIGWDLLEYIVYINPANYDPFMPAGFGPVLTGAATLFFAVFRYDAMSTAAEEATAPSRSVRSQI
jgi:amino acid transporter